MTDNITFLEEKNFLSKSECEYLINFYKKNINSTFQHRDTYPLLLNHDHITYKILTKCETINKNIILDEQQIVKWPVGSYMLPHVDPISDCFASLVYLNDDYKGGETHFKDKKIVPERGKLIIFSNSLLEHWVSPIGKKDRYTLALWFRHN